MVESSEQVTSFVLNHMKRVDMRPKEDFKKLDLVRISGGHITGRIMAFDADHRLAHVDSTIGLGWWYLKDLELQKISLISRKYVNEKIMIIYGGPPRYFPMNESIEYPSNRSEEIYGIYDGR